MAAQHGDDGTVLGIDIGGSGIKGAPVDVEKGVLVGERLRIPTPRCVSASTTGPRPAARSATGCSSWGAPPPPSVGSQRRRSRAAPTGCVDLTGIHENGLLLDMLVISEVSERIEASRWIETTG